MIDFVLKHCKDWNVYETEEKKMEITKENIMSVFGVEDYLVIMNKFLGLGMKKETRNS